MTGDSGAGAGAGAGARALVPVMGAVPVVGAGTPAPRRPPARPSGSGAAVAALSEAVTGGRTRQGGEARGPGRERREEAIGRAKSPSASASCQVSPSGVGITPDQRDRVGVEPGVEPAGLPPKQAAASRRRSARWTSAGAARRGPARPGRPRAAQRPDRRTPSPRRPAPPAASAPAHSQRPSRRGAARCRMFPRRQDQILRVP